MIGKCHECQSTFVLNNDDHPWRQVCKRCQGEIIPFSLSYRNPAFWESFLRIFPGSKIQLTSGRIFHPPLHGTDPSIPTIARLIAAYL